ncbi:conserved hypothetical protein [Ricinus communis]|uniref:Uncharacterized protein n=1 Tax=Ricinus communis TaxID=3988 RepID=B9RNA9_RICCO|nr:conserved hypothetical protein [Ricinus communis]
MKAVTSHERVTPGITPQHLTYECDRFGVGSLKGQKIRPSIPFSRSIPQTTYLPMFRSLPRAFTHSNNDLDPEKVWSNIPQKEPKHRPFLPNQKPSKIYKVAASSALCIYNAVDRMLKIIE